MFVKTEDMSSMEQLAWAANTPDVLIAQNGQVPFRLVGTSSHALGIVKTVRHALKKAGWSGKDISAYSQHMISGSYDELLGLAILVQDNDIHDHGDDDYCGHCGNAL